MINLEGLRDFEKLIQKSDRSDKVALREFSKLLEMYSLQSI